MKKRGTTCWNAILLAVLGGRKRSLLPFCTFVHRKHPSLPVLLCRLTAVSRYSRQLLYFRALTACWFARRQIQSPRIKEPR